MGAVGDGVVAGLPGARRRVAVDAERHQLGVGGHAGDDPVGAVAGHLACDLRAVGRGNRRRVEAEVPAPRVVDESVAVIVDSVAGNLAAVGPDVVGQVGVSPVDAGIDHGHDDADACVAELVPHLLGAVDDHLRRDRGVGVGAGDVAAGRSGDVDVGVRGGPVVEDPPNLRELGETLDRLGGRLERHAVNPPENPDPANLVPFLFVGETQTESPLTARGERLHCRDHVLPAAVAVHAADLFRELPLLRKLVHQDDDRDVIVRARGKERLAQIRCKRTGMRREAGDQYQRGENESQHAQWNLPRSKRLLLIVRAAPPASQGIPYAREISP